ncbi:flagellar protein FlaG [Microvirgula aerodenitrificans]|uniref:flagellar protein FlaG n=1 Tax=Microvirgula aerodenitrificans TaxID=57480 RepID=UPI0028EA0E7F|nr:flagellar protein FlaG [Microvirgula aerodenitrificans]
MQINPSATPMQPAVADARQPSTLPQFAGHAPATPVLTSTAVAPVHSAESLRNDADAARAKDQKQQPDALQKSVQQFNQTMQLMQSDLEFSVDEDTKMRLVKVVNRETNEVIRQIPNEQIVQFAKVFDELRGLLLSDKA